MKKIVLFSAISMWMFAISSCRKETENTFAYAEGYVIGTFVCQQENKDGRFNRNTPMGYCILLSSSKHNVSNYPMIIDFYTFDTLTEVLNLPSNLLAKGCNGSNCGPIFFPDSLKEAYKIKFKYRVLNSTEKKFFYCGPCKTMDLAYPWKDIEEIKINDIVKQ